MSARGHVKIFSRKMDDMTYKCAGLLVTFSPKEGNLKRT